MTLRLHPPPPPLSLPPLELPKEWGGYGDFLEPHDEDNKKQKLR